MGLTTGEPLSMERHRTLHAAALEAVEVCLALQPIKCLREIDKAERAINGLRDGLILDLRQAEPSGPRGTLRAALDQANIALSLVVGVEYPATGGQQKLLQMARDALHAIHLEGTGLE